MEITFASDRIYAASLIFASDRIYAASLILVRDAGSMRAATEDV